MTEEVKIFDILRQINEKHERYEYDKKIAPAWQLLNWLSHDQYLMDYAQNINRLMFVSGMPDKMVYKYFFHAIPKKRRYIKWIKKDGVDKKRKKAIEEIAERRNMSIREAEYIYDLVDRINHNGHDIPF